MSKTTSFSNKFKRWTIIILSVVLLVLLLVLILNLKNLSVFGKSVQEKFTGIETTHRTDDEDGQA